MSPLPEYHLQPTNRPLDFYLRHRDDIDLNTPYQRGSVWSEEQRRNLIKSVLMGIPFGSVLLAARGYRDHRAYLQVVDGKQRIEAFHAFADDQFTIPGTWLKDEYLPIIGPMEVRFSQLSETGRRLFENRGISTIEWDVSSYTIEDPGYDPTLPRVDRVTKSGERLNPKYKHIARTEREMIEAEAELYLLINFGGVAQTDDDRARAEGIARG